MSRAPTNRVFAKCLLTAWVMFCFGYNAFSIDVTQLPPVAPETIDFVRDIQPLLSKHCYSCHGPEKQRNNFRLDLKSAAMKGGDDYSPAIIPHKSAQSPLIHMVSGLVEDKLMPKKGERLTEKEIGLLRAWVDQGAPWPEEVAGAQAKPSPRLWALEPLRRPAVPKVQNTVWVRNPVDAFILSGLESKGMLPTSPADKAVLLRRTSFNLLGLPPSPTEVEEFLNDNSPKAFEKVVERYLASPRYGERWGRHWLDLVRYCESHGFEYDKIRDHAWRYRDYVIDSFNQDKPYAQFVKEQLAGDVLEPQTRDGIVATGFLVCAPWDEAGNNQVGKVMKARVREEEIEDMVAVVGQTFLGLTVNCARCHDHKFDPIPQKDYYAIKAALAGVRHGNRPILTERETKQRDAEKAAIRARLSDLENITAQLEANARERLLGKNQKTPQNPEHAEPKPLARWTFEKDARDAVGTLHGELKGNAIITNGRVRLDGKTAYIETAPLRESLREKTLEAWVRIGALDQAGGAIVSVEMNGNGEKFDALVFGERDPRQWLAGSDFFRRTQSFAGPKESAQDLIHLALVYSSDHSIRLYRNGELYGKAYTPPAGEGDKLQTFSAGASRVLLGLRHHGAGNGFFKGEIEEARLYAHALTPSEIKASLNNGPSVVTREMILAELTSEEREENASNERERAKWQRKLDALSDLPLAYAANSRQPEATFILGRGDVEKPRGKVSPGALSCVAALPGDFELSEDAPEAQRRLKLADWITSPKNPLTARVLVNRVWHYHFGRGLVSTPNDLGANSERPSHPELLDWLASEFQASGGSIKALHRLILLSNSYQQGGRSPDSREHDRAASLDTENRLLWHFPMRRLEAEEVRDSMLALSGNLNTQMAGPGFRPFTVFVNNSHFYNLQDRTEPEFNRRTIYRINVQSGRDPLLDSLDCPDPSTKTPTRAVTTTPIQSLGLMNNTFVQRQAHDLAARLQHEAGNRLEPQVELAWKLAYSRSPRSEELGRARAFASEHGMASLCWVLLNSSELFYVK